MALSDTLAHMMLDGAVGDDRRTAVRLRYPNFDETLAAVCADPSSIRRVSVELAAEVARYAPAEVRDRIVAADSRKRVHAAAGAPGTAPAGRAASAPVAAAELVRQLRAGARPPVGAALERIATLEGAERRLLVAAALEHVTKWEHHPAAAPLAAALLDGDEPVDVDLSPRTSTYSWLVYTWVVHAGEIDSRAARWLREEAAEEVVSVARFPLTADAAELLAAEMTPAAKALLCCAGLPAPATVEGVLDGVDDETFAELAELADPAVRAQLIAAWRSPADNQRVFYHGVPTDGLDPQSLAKLLSWCDADDIVTYLVEHPEELHGYRADLERVARELYARGDSADAWLSPSRQAARTADLGVLWRAFPAEALIRWADRADDDWPWRARVAGYVAARFAETHPDTAQVAYQLLDSWDGTFAELFDTAANLTASARATAPTAVPSTVPS